MRAHPGEAGIREQRFGLPPRVKQHDQALVRVRALDEAQLLAQRPPAPALPEQEAIEVNRPPEAPGRLDEALRREVDAEQAAPAACQAQVIRPRSEADLEHPSPRELEPVDRLGRPGLRPVPVALDLLEILAGVALGHDGVGAAGDSRPVPARLAGVLARGRRSGAAEPTRLKERLEQDADASPAGERRLCRHWRRYPGPASVAPAGTEEPARKNTKQRPRGPAASSRAGVAASPVCARNRSSVSPGTVVRHAKSAPTR